MIRFCNLLLKGFELFGGLEGIEFADALDFDFGQLGKVIAGDFSTKAFLERLEAQIDRCQDRFPGFAFFNLSVNTLFNKDLFQRTHMPLFSKIGFS